MQLSNLKNKRVVVVGYGVEGKATYSFLSRHAQAASLGIADAKDDPDYLAKLKDYDVAIRSPGIRKELISIPYTTATNLFFSLVRGKTIGVTGTKGKSTTASLIAHILQEGGLRVHLVGNIGRPMLTSLDDSNNTDDIWVIELSSFMLDDIQYSPNIAVTVSLYPDHLDYHDTKERYYAAKKQIIKNIKQNGHYFYNGTFREFTQWAEECPCQTTDYTAIEDNRLFQTDETFPLKGAHNVANMAAAFAVAQEFTLPEDMIFRSMRTFKPLPHRLEMIGTWQGITFYDDAISTTPESTVAALKSLGPVDSILVGGLDRGYDFQPLITELIQQRPQVIVAFPDSGTKILGMLKDAGFTSFHKLVTTDMKEAVSFIYQHARENTTCLLSTASPSYSIWSNFEEKGNLFQHWVRNYGSNN